MSILNTYMNLILVHVIQLKGTTGHFLSTYLVYSTFNNDQDSMKMSYFQQFLTYWKTCQSDVMFYMHAMHLGPWT